METDGTAPSASPLDGPIITQQISEQISRPEYPQTIVATLVCLTAAIVGSTEGFLLYLLFQLHGKDIFFETDKVFQPWIVSIYIGATSVGSMLSGIMMELWGRRPAVQIAVSSLHIGWALISLSTVYPLLLVEVAVCGFGIGASIPAIFEQTGDKNCAPNGSKRSLTSIHPGFLPEEKF